MKEINIEEMKRDLSTYLHRVEEGETLVIVKVWNIHKYPVQIFQ